MISPLRQARRVFYIRASSGSILAPPTFLFCVFSSYVLSGALVKRRTTAAEGPGQVTEEPAPNPMESIIEASRIHHGLVRVDLVEPSALARARSQTLPCGRSRSPAGMSNWSDRRVAMLSLSLPSFNRVSELTRDASM